MLSAEAVRLGLADRVGLTVGCSEGVGVGSSDGTGTTVGSVVGLGEGSTDGDRDGVVSSVGLGLGCAFFSFTTVNMNVLSALSSFSSVHALPAPDIVISPFATESVTVSALATYPFGAVSHGFQFGNRCSVHQAKIV